MFIGIDLGGTKTAMMLTDSAGTLLLQRQEATVLGDVLAHLQAAIWTTLQEAEVSVNRLCGIGIGVPGMIDREAGAVVLATNLNISQPVAITEPLSAEFHVPVAIENDVRLATLGVQTLCNVPNLAYLSIGTGVAAGLILNGQLYRGSNNMAGEIGHAIVDDQGTILEKQIAGPALIAAARSARLPIENGADIYQLAQAGNVVATQIIQRVSRAISRTIQWLIVTYDVEQVVLGGGATHAGDAFLTPVLTELAELRSQTALTHRLLPDSKVSLLPANTNAGLLGAIALARQTTQIEPTISSVH